MSFCKAHSLPENLFSVAEHLDKKSCLDEIPRLRLSFANMLNKFTRQKDKALLIVFQGLDASGKDGIISRNFATAPFDAYSTTAFKEPTPLELQHDFLWRVHPHCPPYGHCAVFNRSHYEDILVPNAYGLLPKTQIDQRIESINNFEKHLIENGTIILKFFLNISRKKQGEKLVERQKNPEKQHKFKPSDLVTREHWDAFMDTYNMVFDRCIIGGHWRNIPADKKWQKDYIFLCLIIEKLNEITSN